MASKLVSEADAQKHLEQKLKLTEKRSQKLLALIKDDSGRLTKTSLDKLTTDGQAAIKMISGDFAAADTDKSGFVTPDIANTIITKYFPGLPDSTRTAIVHNYDRDNNQKVDVHEIIEFYMISYLKKDFMEKKFVELDSDGNGVLDIDELLEILCEELCLWPIEAVCIVSDCDKNGDGVIDKAEFLHMWSKLFG